MSSFFAQSQQVRASHPIRPNRLNRVYRKLSVPDFILRHIIKALAIVSLADYFLAITSIVTRKRYSCDYSFVEMSACPKSKKNATLELFYSSTVMLDEWTFDNDQQVSGKWTI